MLYDWEAKRSAIREINLQIDRHVGKDAISGRSIAEEILDAVFGGAFDVPDPKGEVAALGWLEDMADVVLLQRFDPFARGDSPENLRAHADALRAFAEARQRGSDV